MTVGRFAPTPSGRMHLGNLMCAFLAWLSAKSAGGENVLRIEDLDESRCSFGNNAEILKDDLHWIGLMYDRGGEKEGYQSNRFPVYEEYFRDLTSRRLIYPCYCSRAELHAATAPHASDGNPIYDGKCRKLYDAGIIPVTDKKPAWRLRLPETEISFADGIQGSYSENLATDAGDVVIKRSDGVFAYQLAVVVDDGLSGVTEVVRGRDLLTSTARQIYIGRLFGFPQMKYYHIPLLVASDGRRLSKRDGDMDIGAFRRNLSSPEPLIGCLSYHAGLIDRYEPLSLSEAVKEFSWEKVPKNDIPLCGELVEKILNT